MNPHRFIWLIFVLVGFHLFPLLASVNAADQEESISNLQLSIDEQSWLKARPTPRLGVWINSPPYAYLNEEGTPQGIFLDYVTEIESQLNTTFEVVPVLSFADAWDRAMLKELDLLVAVTPSDRHLKYMHLSQTYHVIPIVLVTRIEAPFVSSLKEFAGKKVVVGKGHVTEQWIKLDFPEINVIPSQNYEVGLRMVSESKADAYAGAMAALTWQIKKHRITNLKIAAKTPYEYRLSIAVRKDWPGFIPIINKALDAIKEEKQEAIYDRWVSIVQEQGPDWEYIFSVFGGVLAFSLILVTTVLTWNWRLKKEVRDKQKAEKALIFSQRQLSNLIGNLPGIAYRSHNDQDWTMLYISEGCEALTGYKPSELISNRVTSFNDLIVPSDQQRVQDEVQKAIENDRPFTIEYQIIDKHGNRKWVWEKGKAIKDNTSDTITLEGFINDISDRKEAKDKLIKSEARYRALFDFNPIQTIVVDTDGRIVMYNFAKEKSPGRLPDAGDVMYVDYAAKHKNNMHKALMACIQTGLKRTFTELKYNERYLDINISPFTGGAIITSEDVTERKHLQELLEQVRKMEAVGTLSGGIAHEFNNILGIILGNTELAMDDIPDYNPTHDYLIEVKNASIRGKEIVRQLLSFSHKGAHKKAPIDIAGVVSESMKFLRASIPSSVTFDVDIDEQCNNVMGDKTQIHQLMINLCNNAAQSIEGTNGRLKVRLGNNTVEETKMFAGRQLAPGAYVRLTISDNGKGISPSIIEKIFDPFFTTKDVDQGTGMGLAVVYGIVKGHDGFIEVMSAPERGTDFICYFPTTEATPSVVKEINERAPKGDGHIIFVDDEISLVNISKQYLERLGYQVEATTEPHKALEIFKADPTKYHLVITDMTMPQMTGDQLIEALKKIREDIKTIICTGYSKHMDEKKAMQLGATDYIMKPVDQKSLGKTVLKLLNGDM